MPLHLFQFGDSDENTEEEVEEEELEEEELEDVLFDVE